MSGEPLDLGPDEARRASVAVIGAGPAGLMAAEVAAARGLDVTVFDRMPSPARKFLLAGRGGLNLTHSESAPTFLSRYGASAERMAPILARFDQAALRHWCEGLGVATFVGTSGRVFPTAMKTSPLLRAWLRRLDASGVHWRMRHTWQGFDDEGRLQFATPDGAQHVSAAAVILAMGGASWPQLGSDGRWTDLLAARGIATVPLAPANCGFHVEWSPVFRDRFEGQPLKNVSLGFEGAGGRGDLMVTRSGLEGGPLYALAASFRTALDRGQPARLTIDLRPDLDIAALASRLSRRRGGESLSNALRKHVGLAPVDVALLREAALSEGIELQTLDAASLAARVKAVAVTLTAPMPIARAISSAGGIAWRDLGADLMLRPGLFAAGEMIDWEAPTGGYLLQACFATGVVAGHGVADWLSRQDLKKA